MDNSTSDHDNQSPSPNPGQQRLERLGRFSANRQVTHSAAYTSFIRRMRLLLPLLAVCIIVALMTWPDRQSTIAILEDSQKESLQTIRKNELSSPKFESVDNKNQPFTITAARAVQADDDEDILLLERPVGELQLNTGGRVTLKSESGKYWQEQEQLELQENVELSNSDGYTMGTAQLSIDLDASTARSETDVSGFGPAGTLVAKGLHADNAAGVLVFNGPARLVLKDAGSLQGLAGGNKSNQPPPSETPEIEPDKTATDITEAP